MKIQEFKNLVMQMKSSSVPMRLVFLWKGRGYELEAILIDVETTHQDVATVFNNEKHETQDSQVTINEWLKEKCKVYEDMRNEPSALIIQNAILLARYNCDLTPIFKFGLSPRSAVILLFPKESQRKIPVRTEQGVKKDLQSVLLQVTKQLGEPNCIIEEQGD